MNINNTLFMCNIMFPTRKNIVCTNLKRPKTPMLYRIQYNQ